MNFKIINSKVQITQNTFRTVAVSRGKTIVMDRPEDEGGHDSFPTPVEYFLTALGGCVAMTLQVFAKHKGWDVGKIEVLVTQKKTLTPDGIKTILYENITFENDISESQKLKLLEMASKCPISKLIEDKTEIIKTISMS